MQPHPDPRVAGPLRQGSVGLTDGPTLAAILAAIADNEPLDRAAQALGSSPDVLRQKIREALEKRRAQTAAAPAPAVPAGALVINTDGASRGNPGPASIGVVLRGSDGAVVDTIARAIGRATNNHAEYEAVRSGLERARELGARKVHVRADSELAIRQLSGLYQVKNEKLRPLFEAVKKLERAFPSGVTYEHVRREQNADADALANEALDRLV